MLVSVVIPTANEREAVSDVISGTKRALDGYSYEIIVVDKSSDETPTLAAKAGAQVIRQSYRGGVGAAFREGFSHARGDVVVTIDGDGTYDPADIPRIVEPILSGTADFVNGNRLTANREEGSMTMLNLVGNRILTWVGNVCFQSNVRDSQSGMKAARRDLLERMSLFESGFPTVSELIGEAVRARGRIVEVPIAYSQRRGNSKLSPARDGIKIFFATLLLMRDYNPLLLFGGIGLFLIMIGALASTPVITEYVHEGTFHLIGRALLSSVFTISGLIFILLGLMLDSTNFSIRRLEARILGLSAPHESSGSLERHTVEPPQSVSRAHAVASAVREDQATPDNLEALERIAIRRAVADVLRSASYSARSPGMLRGESGIDYDFDIVASRGGETWVLDIASEDTPDEGSAVLSLFAKVLDVRPSKATLLAVPTISPQAGRLAQMYNIQVVVGNSTGQLCDVMRIMTGASAST